jgi:hypothetical protein
MKYFAIGVLLSAVALQAAQVDFQREVRPILSANCFSCHGPDKGTRMAGMRLDTRDGAFSQRKNGAPIVPGDPQASLAIQRITETNPARRMPPEMSHKTLTDAQKETLKRWVAEGAQWKEQWAFVAPVRPALPPMKTENWVRNPIDRFILAKLEAQGLSPAPEADRQNLIRRVTLDLTGLPPTPEEVVAFGKDTSPNAYEKVVDRLLASPHYGEHRARYWLDAARYGDTHGIHVDNYREIWPYRDWVIQAFNRNMPFDRFTIEQIAGDLLPNATLENQIASGFHRCGMSTNEAGSIEDEILAMYAKDRVDTTSAVWLGLTVGCATCHDHKFDPIAQRDFYSMSAFFRNTTQKAMDDNISDTPPIVVVPRIEDRDRWTQLKTDEKAVRQQAAEIRAASNDSFTKWLATKEYQTLRRPLDSESELLVLSPQEGMKALKLAEGVTWGADEALHFGTKAAQELPTLNYFDTAKPFSVSVRLFFPLNEDNFNIASQSDKSDKNRGWAIEISGQVVAFRLTGADGKNLSIRAPHLDHLKPATWNDVAVSYDGTGELAGMALYVNGKKIFTQGSGEYSAKLQGNIHNSGPLRLGNEGGRYFAGGAIADFRVLSRAISEDEASIASKWPVLESATQKDTASLTGAEREALQLYYLTLRDPGYRQVSQRMVSLTTERRAIRRRGATSLVMEEKTDTKPMAHILNRGQYDQPRDKVEPNVPYALPPMSPSMPRNRLGLAQWLVDASNPLTSRVTVNRYWQEVFGTGIVKTAEDFGSQGEAPSHPELLDWLAVDFRESGWDIKRFFKQMVMSAAYRQSAATTPEKVKKDPDNRLLAHGPRYRMDGEMVRDYALAVSGLLTPTIGGPSVKPYQPSGVWETVAMEGSNTRFYKPDSGDKLYRRSLYTFWKRSAPPPSMELFNASTRESCVVRRERTDTPLQALVTMNDPQFVEAARRLAANAELASHGKIDREIDFIASRLVARSFEPKERAILESEYRDYLSYYGAHPDDAKKLISVGDSKPNAKINPAKFAALTMVANQVMNLDEVLNK